MPDALAATDKPSTEQPGTPGDTTAEPSLAAVLSRLETLERELSGARAEAALARRRAAADQADLARARQAHCEAVDEASRQTVRARAAETQVERLESELAAVRERLTAVTAHYDALRRRKVVLIVLALRHPAAAARRALSLLRRSLRVP